MAAGTGRVENFCIRRPIVAIPGSAQHRAIKQYARAWVFLCHDVQRQKSEDERADRLLAVLAQCDARRLPQFIEALKTARITHTQEAYMVHIWYICDTCMTIY